MLQLFGMSAQIACWAAFAIGEIALFLLEKLFVYRDNALNDNAKQIIYSVINAALHLGIFGALSSIGKYWDAKISLHGFSLLSSLPL